MKVVEIEWAKGKRKRERGLTIKVTKKKKQKKELHMKLFGDERTTKMRSKEDWRRVCDPRGRSGDADAR